MWTSANISHTYERISTIETQHIRYLRYTMNENINIGHVDLTPDDSESDEKVFADFVRLQRAMHLRWEIYRISISNARPIHFDTYIMRIWRQRTEWIFARRTHTHTRAHTCIHARILCFLNSITMAKRSSTLFRSQFRSHFHHTQFVFVYSYRHRVVQNKMAFSDLFLRFV